MSGRAGSPVLEQRFRDRVEAGRELAKQLGGYADRDDVLVLGLPRGGVPVAFEVAQALHAPLDVFLVRKLGVPGHDEYAMGAIASGGVRVINRELVESLDLPAEWIEAIEAKELRELERRERAYRGDRPPPDVTGRTVLLVDDGLATGSTMLAAATALRQDAPARLVVAVPVGSSEACDALRAVADEVVCVLTPQRLYGVGAWYEDFSQTATKEVIALLERARRPAAAPQLAGLHALTGAATDYDPLLQRAARRGIRLDPRTGSGDGSARDRGRPTNYP